MKTVVTGATGHIGAALLVELKNRNIPVTAFVLNGEDYSHIKDLCAEVVFGDILDKQSLVTAFGGASDVYHIAGVISIGNENKKYVKQVNVEGTKNVIEAAKECGVKNLVYTSSVHVIPLPKKNGVMDENFDTEPKKVVGHYAKTKAEALNLFNAENCGSMRTVITMPSGVTGPYTYIESNIGAMIKGVAKGSIRVNIKGVYDFVDTRDVAFALAELMVKGENGQRYILSGNSMPAKDMIKTVCETLEIKTPRVTVPMFLAKTVAPFAEMYYGIKKKKPVFTPYSLYTITSNHNFSHQKLTDFIGYNPRPAAESLKDEVKFMCDELGLVPNKKLKIKNTGKK